MDIGSLSLAIDLYAPEQVIRELKQIDAVAQRVADNAEDNVKEQQGYWAALYKFLKQKIRETEQLYAGLFKKIDDQQKYNAKMFEQLEREKTRVAQQEAAKRARIEQDQQELGQRSYKRALTALFDQAIANETAKNRQLLRQRTETEQRSAQMQERMQSRLNALFPQRVALTRSETQSRLSLYAGMFEQIGRNETRTANAAARERVRIARMAEREITQTQAREAASRQRATLRFRATLGAGLGVTGGLGGTIAGVAVLRGIVQASNDLQTLEQRLKQVSDTAGQTQFAMRNLSEASQRLRVPIADLGELYVKLRQSNAAVGLSMGETMTVTKAFAAALRLSGATGQAASSALLQFGQAMAKGKLDGDEFRTVAENASEVLRILERQLGKTRGELLEMREKGLLTAKMMADALSKEADNLLERVSKLPPTLDQAAISFRNSIIMMVGQSANLRTAMGNIAEGIIRVGNFLSGNAGLIGGLIKATALAGGLAIAFRALSGAAALAASSGGLLNAAIMRFNANPIVMGLGLIATAAFTVAQALNLIKERANDLSRQRVLEMADPLMRLLPRAGSERGDARLAQEFKGFIENTFNPAIEAEKRAQAQLKPLIDARNKLLEDFNLPQKVAKDGVLDLSQLTPTQSRDLLGSKSQLEIDGLRTRFREAQRAIDDTRSSLGDIFQAADEARQAISMVTEETLAMQAGNQAVSETPLADEKKADKFLSIMQQLAALDVSLIRPEDLARMESYRMAAERVLGDPRATAEARYEAQQQLNTIKEIQLAYKIGIANSGDFLANVKAIAEESPHLVPQEAVERMTQIEAKARELLISEKDNVDVVEQMLDVLRDVEDIRTRLAPPNEFQQTLELLTEEYDNLSQAAIGAYASILEVTLAEAVDEIQELEKAIEQANMEGRMASPDLLRRMAKLQNRVKGVSGALGKMYGADETDKKDKKGPMTDEERFDVRMRRQMYELLRAGPADMISAFFEGLGERVEDGGNTVAEKMRTALGNILSTAGSNLLQRGVDKLIPIVTRALGGLFTAIAGPTTVLGKFIESIKTVLSNNPLLAGLALVAIGGAMLAFGRSLGGATRGAMGMGGGGAGGIGGLGIGGRDQSQIYRFADRPYQSPMAGMGAASSSVQPVVVNATVIGPNDPQAQRQISDLVNNAARRGLMTGSASRTR